jgi:autotransporter-associated beta strand protein
MTGGTITNITGTQPFDYYNSTATIAVINTLPASTTATISSGFRPRFASSTTLTLNVAQGTTSSGIDLAISGPIVYSAATSFSSLTKSGAGTAQLGGVNTYTQPTTVNAGRLTLGGGSLGNTAITVNGGTFGVQPGSATTINAGTTTAGTAGATLTLDANTIFDMTDGAISTFNLQQEASFATAGLTLASGATFKFDLGNSSADKLAVTKTASVSGTVNVFLNTSQMTSPTAGTYNLITAASGLTGGTWEFAGSSGTTENVIVGGNIYSLTLGASGTAISVTVGAGTATTATQLAFTTQPTSTTVGATMAANPVVQLENSSGGAVAIAGVPITLSGVPGLSGTLTVFTGSGGSATFSGLTVPTLAQSGVTLTASAQGLTVGTSTSFNITGGTATQLVITSAPVATTAGTASSSITVQREDQYGNPTTNGITSVRLSSTSTGTVTFTPSSPTIATGSSSASFTYTDTLAGTPTITASASGLASATQVETVNAAAPSLGFPVMIVPEGLGVNIHFTGDPTQDLSMIQAAGFKFVRMDFAWNWIETTQGQYNFQAYDQLYDACTSLGIRILGILDYGNSLYGTNANTETFLQGYTQFAAATAAHFQKDGIIWEIWNEPNTTLWPGGANVTQYMALVTNAVPAIRQADTNATIIAPATSGIDTNFLTGCFQQGLLNLVDAVSVHPYLMSPPEPVAADYLTLSNLILQYHPSGPLPIVSSEWGYTTAEPSYPISDQLQGDYLARMFLMNLSQGIPLSIWYDWIDDGTNSTDPEDNFGTVNTDYTVKPAYQEMELLTSSLQGKSFVNQLSSASGDYLLAFSGGGEQTVAAWTTNQTHSVTVFGQSVSLSSTPVYVTTVQLGILGNGNQVTLQYAAGTLYWANSLTGSWTSVPGASPPAFATNVMSAQMFFRVMP